jgi:hypothetical protein
MKPQNFGFGKIAVLAVHLDPQPGQHIFQEPAFNPFDRHHERRTGAGDPGIQRENKGEKKEGSTVQGYVIVSRRPGYAAE